MKRITYKILMMIAMIPFVFVLNHAASAATLGTGNNLKSSISKQMDSKAMMLAKGQNNLPKKPSHC